MSTTLLGEASSDGVGRILTFEHAALSGRIECEHRPGIQALRPDADGTCDRTWPSSLALAQMYGDASILGESFKDARLTSNFVDTIMDSDDHVAVNAAPPLLMYM